MDNDSDIYQYSSEPSQRYGYQDGETFDFQTIQENHHDVKDSEIVHSDIEENLNRDLENGGLSNGKTLNHTSSNNTINNSINNYNNNIKNINNNSMSSHNNTNTINNTNNYNNNNVSNTINSTDYESIFALNSFGLPSNALFGGTDPSNIVYRPNNMISNLESPENFPGVDFEHAAENQNQANVSFSMPGAFHDGDNMDLDESPPFTIESETYYDPHIESTSINHETESLFKANGNANTNVGNTLLAPQQRTPTQRIESSFSPFDNSSRVSSFRVENGNGINPNGGFVFNHVTTNADNGVNQSGPVLGSVDNYYSNINGNSNANNIGNTNNSSGSKNGNDNSNSNGNGNGNGNGNFNNNNINNTTPNSHNTNSVYNTNNGNYLSVHSNITGNAFSNASLGQNSNNNFYNELSPITTTTSLTPSISSVHSTQPSFFSAHQFLTRNSLDQGPPTHLVSSSFDLFNKGRPSMDSQQSSSRRNPSSGRYTSFTNSLTNMIPFMGDRNQRSPISGPPSPQSQNSSSFMSQPPPQQPRHLIRSIFKSNSAPNNVQAANDELTNAFVIDESSDPFVSGSGNTEDFLMMSPTKEEPELEAIDVSVQPKKAKRSKRSLFTRFKGPSVKQEPIDENEMLMIDEFAVKEGENLDNSTSTSGPFQPTSISRTPSTATGNFLDSASSSNTSHNQSQSQLLPQSQTQPQNPQSQEPDYASLFENVGKRKIVNTSSYRKSKTKVKNEDGTTSNNSNSTVENSPILNVSLGNKKIKTDSEIGSGNNSGHTTEKSSLHNLRLSHQRSNQSSGNNISVKEEYSDRGSVGGMSSKSNTSKDNRLHPQSSEEVDISDDESTTSTTASSNFATASKRILGSKLMKKKTSPVKMPVATVINKGVEVEVDLKSLDLPPNTQIFPTSIINSKNRTRGRKENKEADMVDSTKIYLCNYCSRRFKRQEHLKRHFRSLHTFEKPYDCTICNKKFSRSDNLNQHLKIHKQEEEAAALEKELLEQGSMAKTKVEDELME
ncbi:zf-C2H2 Zinc finger, C2H2 type [Scheffersomyces stipitis CBS 6054]|uniref:Zf-C2H2 Zinc finger, C2H2 type n=1 Tax=Scheffersomyces stipitis (strain ATCC 58785 / CBS 6054 / NBRC 10063 / NRRL Y-11545) TaxID=322104 RepID=A3LYY2_PICST|nr:zf-C2H2 Zinc finger, C2H2 type [Scheffersomyces stipitis CBS 6054]ABN68060.2 zf-C2H2 Zinc finger, C2H2 type [Scheffersomyces stipitis CBS 6054]